MKRREFESASVTTIDLEDPIPDLTGSALRVVALVRYGVHPVGTIEFEGPRTAAEVAVQIWDALGSEVASLLKELSCAAVVELPLHGLPSIPIEFSEPRRRTIAVAIATHDRHESLERCLRSLRCLRVAPDQVIVVDNAPSSPATLSLIERWNDTNDLSIHYVREDTPGLAIAHNTALAVTRTELLAFTDDDVLVDRYWTERLLCAFDAVPSAACVTGMIFPAELETWPQQWVESRAGFNKGFGRRVFDEGTNRPPDPLFPFTAGSMGSGANMAFTTAYLNEAGGFHPALGAGTLALGGDDLHAFHTVVRRGYSLAYEPSAVVFHHHHRDAVLLERQAWGYGASLAAYLTSIIHEDPRSLVSMLRRAPAALRHAIRTTAAPVDFTFPGQRRLAWRQRTAMLAGPLRYVRSTRAVAR